MAAADVTTLRCGIDLAHVVAAGHEVTQDVPVKVVTHVNHPVRCVHAGVKHVIDPGVNCSGHLHVLINGHVLQE